MVEGPARDAYCRMKIILVVQTEVKSHLQHPFFEAHLLLAESEVLEFFPKVVEPLLIVATFQSRVIFLQR